MQTEQDIQQYLEVAQEALSNGILTDIMDGTQYAEENPFFSIKWTNGKVDTIEYDHYDQAVILYEDIQSSPSLEHNDEAITLEEFSKYLMNPITMEESCVIEEKYQKEDGFGSYDGYQNHDDKKAYQAKLDREKSDRDNNLTESEKIITIKADDVEGSLEDMLKHIQNIGNTGHSFSIDVDPDGEKDQHRIFGWDGDGGDYIEDITIERIKENKMKEDLKEGYMSIQEYKNKLNGLSDEELVNAYNSEFGFDYTYDEIDAAMEATGGFDRDEIIEELTQAVINSDGNGGRMKNDLQQDPRNIREAKKSCNKPAGAPKCNNGKCTCKKDLNEGRIIKIAQMSGSFNSYKQNLEKYFQQIGSKRYFNELLADAQKLGVRGEGTDESLEKGVYLKINESKDFSVNNILKDLL